MRLKLSFITLSILFSFLGFSQNTNKRLGEDLEYCRQHKILEQNLKDPVFKAQFELDQQVLKDMEKSLVSNPSKTRGTIYTIPIVFHVIHQGGAENISREQIENAVAILNEDYRLLNKDAADVHSDFKDLPADCEIQFKLATKDPVGNCFGGITRTYSTTVTTDGYDQVAVIKAGNDVYRGEWPGNKYLNVIVTTDVGGAAGYTNYPYGSGKSMTNGIFIVHTYIGGIGTSSEVKSTALTHEVGHWLNLPHTWGSTNDPGLPDNCNTDDGVDDTPNTVGVTYCNLNENTCGVRANVENYMDYSYCSKMFTPGQALRMRAALESSVGGRKNIWTSSNLTATGANTAFLCSADFSSNVSQTCEGGVISFVDESINTPISWKWSFPGGTPSTSTERNPSITYDKAGTYDVSLIVSDGVSSKSIAKQGVVTVFNQRKELPFLEGFEDIYQLSDNPFWEVYNPDVNAKFEVFTGAAHTGNKCVKLGNYGQSGTNTDELISGALDLSGVKSQSAITLTYRFAYRKKSSSVSEVLRLSLSSDCGSSWNSRRTLTGSNLSSIIDSSDWTPSSASNWTTVHITNITSAYWNANTRMKFTFEGNGGNNIYLDDINVYESGPTDILVAGVQENESLSSFSVYPNPADEELTISFELEKNQDVAYRIVDIYGREIYSSNVQGNAGANWIIFPTKELAKGSYFIQMNVNSNRNSKQFQVR